MTKEKRVYSVGELRAEAQDGAIKKIVGLGVKYNALSQDFGGWRERFQAGAFQFAENVRCLFNHDSNFVLGDTRSKSLALDDKADGLYFECALPQRQTVQDLVGDPIARGTVAGCSFMFQAIDTRWEMLDGVDVRTVTKAELFEVGPVTWPAYPDTNVQARALEELAQFRSGKAAATARASFQHIAEKITACQPLSEVEAAEFRALVDAFGKQNKSFNPVEAAHRARTLQLLGIDN